MPRRRQASATRRTVIAGALRQHPARLLPHRLSETHRVASATKLEGPYTLEIFALEKKRTPR
jgi:hypothetical protein